MGRGRQRCESLPGRQKPNLGEPEEASTALGLEEGPVFYPTEDEFSDPLRFIAQIREQAEPYGICRIVPPTSWNPPFALDSQSFIFPTKHQSIHQLQERTAACDAETFKLEYGRYLQKEGRELETWPEFEGEVLDLCKLYNAVKRHGGYNKVRDEKKWGEVYRMVRESSPAPPANAVLATLSELYESHLQRYESHQNNASAGKLLRIPKRQVAEVKGKGKRAGRKYEGEQEITESVKRRKIVTKHMANGEQVVEEEWETMTTVTETKVVMIDEQRVDQICEQCHSGAHEKSMLLCDRCNRGWHLYCLSPPLAEVPHGNWYCLDCLASSNDSFGFAQGKEYSYESFQRFAERFKRKWFTSRAPKNSDVENDFWRIVERATASVEVLYGSDIDTGLYGSGFPRASDPVRRGCDPETWASYITNPWNLNNFPKLEGSMLRMVQDNIPGVIVPWLYMGMLFSSFCWHYEDHCFYSVNYLHRLEGQSPDIQRAVTGLLTCVCKLGWCSGAPKTWYSVPGSAASAFEEVMQKSFPDLFEAQPDLLFQLVTMLNPTVLRDSNVPVCTTTQEVGNFVITFPRSYHGGFNHGFNCAEAVNFAPADWLPMGGFAVERYRFYHKAAVLSHDELLCVVAKNKVSAVAKPFVQEELGAIIKRERSRREQLWASGVVKSTRMAPRVCQNHISTEEDPMCIICRYYLHLSAVVCSCRPAKAVCLQHARQLCECPADQQRLLYRHSLAELDDLLCEEKENLEDFKVGVLAAVSKPTKRSLRRGAPLNQSLFKKVMGRNMSHTDLAEKWLARAKMALHGVPTIAVIQDLLLESEQFLWAGHEMDSMRVVEKNLFLAHKWAEDVARSWATIDSWLQPKDSKPPKVMFAVVQHLVATDPVPCVEPYLPFVQAFYETAKCMQQQILKFTSSQPPLQRASLEALIKEVSLFPLDFVELSGLQQLLNSAKAWSERVRKLLPPIKALRSRSLVNLDQLLALQQEGLSLPVKQEDKEILDLVIKKAEALQHHVTDILGLVLPIQEVDEVVQEVQGLPVHVPGLQELEQRLADARAWLLRAKPTLAHIYQYKDYNISITLLTDLIQAASHIRVQLDDVKVAQVTLKKIEWMDAASKALLETPSTKILTDLLNEATKLQLSSENTLLQVQEVAQTALTWEARAELALKHGDSYDNYVNLIGAAGDINVQLEGLSTLKSVLAHAISWREQARPYVNKRSKGAVNPKENSLQLSALQALVEEALKLQVKLEERTLLQEYYLEAQRWTAIAVELLKPVQLSLCTIDGSEGPCAWDSLYLKTNLAQLEEQQVKLQKVLEEGLDLGLDFPAISDLETLLGMTGWSIRAFSLLRNRPRLEDAQLILKEGKRYEVEMKAGALLQGAVQKAESWQLKVAAIVPFYGAACTCTTGQLEQLLCESQALPLSVTTEGDIRHALESYRAWQTQVHDALDGGEGYLTRAGLLQLQEATVASWLESVEKEQLCSVLAGAEFWLSSCRDAIAAPSAKSPKSVRELLTQMHQSVMRAVARVEGEEVPCVCGQPLHKADASMLHCDSCDDWYHPTCLGLSQFYTRAQKQYICPYCTALSTGVLTLSDDAYVKVHATRRPPLAPLMELLDSASSIPCRMEEREILQELVTAFCDWQCHLSDIIEPALVHHEQSSSVDVCSLLRALKAVGALELQEQAGCRVKLAVATNAWRTRAINLLDGTGKPSLRCISKSVREAASVPVANDDCVLQDLRLREAQALDLTDRARQVIGDEGKAHVEDVRALIAEGERLQVSLAKELSALRTRSLLYCICRKPYDKQQAMIACDRCGEWYHYSCLHLPEPEPEDSDESSLIQHDGGEFVCPDCSQARHVRMPQCQEEVGDSPLYKQDTKGSPCKVEPPETPETPMEMEVPQAGLRGKRSSRGKTKAVQQSKWQFSHVLIGSGNNSSSSSSEAETPSSGRPCRRTAGRHSGFENYVLLMRSR